MLQALPLSNSSLWPRLKPLWEEFSACAVSDYSWHEAPLPFNVVTTALQQQLLHGFLLADNAAGRDWGWVLYGAPQHNAIEINALVLRDGAEVKSSLDTLFRAFLGHATQLPHWDTISYALLGKQKNYSLTAPWYGFRPIGQCIVRLDFLHDLTLPVLQKQHETLPPLPEGMSVVTWQEYFAKRIPTSTEIHHLAEAIVSCFSKEVDALWDPRFRDVEGAKHALNAMINGDMGVFRPEWTTLLLQNNQPIGFCFLLHTDAMTSNIALIGVNPTIKTQGISGLGTQLLRYTLVNMMKGIAQGQWMLSNITATTGTDNLASLKLYRRFGFAEQSWYPHLYLNKATALESYYGKPYFDATAQAGCCH